VSLGKATGGPGAPATTGRRVLPPRDAAVAGASTTADPGADAGAEPESGPPWLRLASWLGLALALVLLAGSLLLWTESRRADDTAAASDAATSAGRTAVETMLSYDYKTFDAHTATVEKLLTGSFKDEFAKAATANVKPLALQNQAVVQARTVEAGVMSSSADSVRVLAFVDQTTTSAKLDRPQVDQNRVILTMTQVDGRWLVSKVEAF